MPGSHKESALSFTRLVASGRIREDWKKLSAGGKKVACGWLKDKYGLFWQITPTMLTRLKARF